MKKKYFILNLKNFFLCFLKTAFNLIEFMKAIEADFYPLKVVFLHYAKVSTCQIQQSYFTGFFTKKLKINCVI